jgi:hypothetical protein
VKYKGRRITKLEFITKKAMSIKIKDTHGVATLIGKTAVDGFVYLDLPRGKTSFAL